MGSGRESFWWMIVWASVGFTTAQRESGVDGWNNHSQGHEFATGREQLLQTSCLRSLVVDNWPSYDMWFYSALFDENPGEWSKQNSSVEIILDFTRGAEGAAAVKGCKYVTYGGKVVEGDVVADITMDEWRNGIPHQITCQTYPEATVDPPAQVSLVFYESVLNSSLAGLPLLSLKPVERIFQQSVGKLAMCAGPVFNARAPHLLEEWLEHHSELGIEHFRIYSPIIADHPAVAAPTHSNVSWVRYTPHPGRWYYAQLHTINDCVYRLRHAYDFVLVADPDEFLAVPPPLGSYKTQNADLLLELFEKHLASPIMAAKISTWQYPGDCPINPQESQNGSFWSRLRLREPQCMGHVKRTKAVVRPSAIQHMWVHWPIKHIGKVVDIPCDVAFWKHYVQLPDEPMVARPNGIPHPKVACSDLVEEV